MVIRNRTGHDHGQGRRCGPAPLPRCLGFAALALSLPIGIAAAGCAPVAQNADDPVNESAGSSAPTGPILVRSAPADGATVSAPTNLSLTFREPVRLIELVVVGPSGEMPMMVTAAGAQAEYSLPLSGLEPGRHEVRWRAQTADAAPLEGRLSFTVL